MSIEGVQEYFRQFGIEDRIKVFDVSSATVDLAAAALGYDQARIAKTLSFSNNGGAILVVCTGDAKVSNAKFKATFGTKPRMLPHDEVEALIGHRVGGVCPYAINSGIPVYLDESLFRFETVFPACGSSNSAIELTVSELLEYARATDRVDVCRMGGVIIIKSKIQIIDYIKFYCVVLRY